MITFVKTIQKREINIWNDMKCLCVPIVYKTGNTQVVVGKFLCWVMPVLKVPFYCV